MSFRPRLEEIRVGDLPVISDPGASDLGAVIAFTSRAGGVSTAPYAGLNLSTAVGDDDAAVTANRARVLAAVGDERELALARQVHGSDVISVRDERGIVGDADALVTDRPDVVIGVLTADCAPVIVVGELGIAVAHAGWRGLVRGVVESAVARAGVPLAAWVGPSIHACCYVVGEEVVAAFDSADLPSAGDRVDPGRAAAVALRRAGVPLVAASDVCTSCDRRYFSHRRDSPTGRQGAFAALTR